MTTHFVRVIYPPTDGHQRGEMLIHVPDLWSPRHDAKSILGYVDAVAREAAEHLDLTRNPALWEWQFETREYELR